MNRNLKIVCGLAGAVVLGLAVADGMLRFREAKRVKIHVMGTQSDRGRLVFAAFEMKTPKGAEHFIYSPAGPTLVWPGHTAVVEQARVLLEGVEFTAIPAATTNIFLAVTSGVFAVRIDGVELKAAGIAK